MPDGLIPSSFRISVGTTEWVAPESTRNSIERLLSGSAGFAISTVRTVMPMPEFYLGGACVSVRVVSVAGGGTCTGIGGGSFPLVSVLKIPPVRVVSVFVGGGVVGGGAYCVPVVSVDV